MGQVPGTPLASAARVTAENPPFLRRIAYRTDDYSSLRHVLLEALAQRFPRWNRELAAAEGPLDPSVVLAELHAALGDALGFYQDARANEVFLRTAVLPASVLELCALLDYAIPPGAASSTLQAFLLEAGMKGTIPGGHRINTEAGDGVPSLVFETARALEADAARNRLKLLGHDRTSRVLNAPASPASTALLSGTADGLGAGSFVIFDAPGTAAVPVRLTAVTAKDGKTRLTWKSGALPSGQSWPIADLVVHGKPKQAMSLFDQARADEITAGETSVQVATPSLLAANSVVLFSSQGLLEPAVILAVSNGTITWNRGFLTSLRRSTTEVFLGEFVGTTSLPRRGALVVSIGLTSPSAVQAGDQLLVRDAAGVERVRVAGVVRNVAYGRSDEKVLLADPLPRSFQPLPTGGGAVELYRVRLPAEGIAGSASTRVQRPSLSPADLSLTLDRTYEGLVSGARVVLEDGSFLEARRVQSAEVDAEGRTVLFLDAAVGRAFDKAALRIHGPMEDELRLDGFDRADDAVPAGTTQLTFQGAPPGLNPGDALAIEGGGRAEGARIAAMAVEGGNLRVDLEEALVWSYPRADAVVYGNVVPATHGETVIEKVLGSGDGSTANQLFPLAKGPVTHVHDPMGPRGVSSTIEVFVADERWTRVESLAESAPDDRHFMVEMDEEEKAAVRFGDGRHGARLPSGRDNVRARYRVGIGLQGNVPAGRISVMPEPLSFVESSRNSIAAAGGAGREGIETTRELAPMTVRTLDRAVSLSDYADLARTHAGIGKARADWGWEEGRRSILLTVATVDGAALPPALKESLRAHLESRRSPHHRLLIRDHRPWPVRLSLDIQVLPSFVQIETKRRVEEALGRGLAAEGGKGYFHFDRRGLGEDIFLSDIYAAVEGVRGVDNTVARAFHPETATPPSEPILDRIRVPADALATGGHPTDALVGILQVRAAGGVR